MMMQVTKARKKKDSLVKSALSVMIKYVSVLAIFIAIGVISVIYLGPDIKIVPQLQVKLVVASIILAISIVILYELWLKNGRTEASKEEDYLERLNVYYNKSNGLYYPTLQDFLDYEQDRRYTVELQRILRVLDRETSVLNKIIASKAGKLKIWLAKHRVRRITKASNNIRVSIPYEKSEEFDYLRYSVQDIVRKEYSPSDTVWHLAKRRTKKYVFTATFSLIGFNILSIGATLNENIWQAVIMITLAVLSLLYAVIDGYAAGYTNISVVNLGVYNTAISFLDQAVAYCKKNNKDLYYNGPTEFRVTEPDIKQEILHQEPDDFFTKAAISVTGTD